MKLITKILILHLLIIGTRPNLCAQIYYMEAGVPFIKNYTSKEYGAHSQNFVLAQSHRGLMYFGNFMGILEYDGRNWNTILTPNISKVSALAADTNGQIYVGARGELGYLSPDAYGNLEFASIFKDSTYSELTDEITHIHVLNEIVYFFSKNKIFLYTKENIEIIESEKQIRSAFLCNGQIFCQLNGIGLTRLKDKKLQPVFGGEFFSGISDIKSILQHKKNEYIVATDIQGLFKLTPHGVHQFNSEATNYLIKNNLTCGTKLQDNSYAYGTQRGGIVNIYFDGSIKQVISKNVGLQNNYVHQLYATDNYLWAALNNGLARIETPSPLSYHDETSGLNGGVLHLGKYKGSLFIGTYNGLFFQNKKTALFQPINDINSACWSFIASDHHLLAATSEGIFQISNNTVKKISSDFTLCIHQSENNKLYVGTTNGVKLFENNNNIWTEKEKIKGINYEIREIFEDPDGVLWFISPSNGIFSFNPNSNKGKTRQWGFSENLPSLYGNHFCKTDNQMVIATIDGLYSLNKSSSKFQQYSIQGFDSTFANQWFKLVSKEEDGVYWTLKGDETSISQHIKANNNKFKEKRTAFKQIADFVIWDIFFDENNLVWLGGPDGLIRYQNKTKTKYKKEFQVFIRSVYTNNDSLLFGGHNSYLNYKDSIIKNNITIPRLKYGSNINFSYSGISYNYKEIVEYKYYLEGFDKTWSEWTKSPKKEYTNLSGGDYTFHVKAKDIFGNISKESIYQFKILTPWYFKWWAYIIYFILLGSFVYLVVKWRLRKLAKEKHILENLVQERTAEISEQKEEIERQSRGIELKNYELEKINFIVKSINAEIDLTNMLLSILEKTKVIRGVEKATALIYDKESGSYMFKASYGWDLSAMGLSEIRLSQEEAEIRYIDGTDEIHEDVFYAKEVAYSKAIEILDSLEKPKSKLVLVLKIENHVEGFVLLENMHKRNAFTEEDLSLVKNLKEHIISAFIKAKILEDLQDTLKNLKETQEELIRQEKLASLGKLTKGIVDRVINPLNYINNFSNISGELIEELDEILDEEKEHIDESTLKELQELTGMVSKNMDKIKGHGISATRIVKAMEGLMKDKSNNFIATDIQTLLNQKIELAFKECCTKYKYTNVKLTTNFEDIACNVKVMHEEFGQMLQALIDNAFFIMLEKTKTMSNYTPEISIKTKTSATHASILLSDNGTGMPKTEIDKIFDPFFTTKTTSEGTGLGLYMCKDIVEAHNGTLNVESTEGESTTFIITLPLEKEIHSRS